MKFLALLLLLPSPALASPLAEAFNAYVKVRQAEEGLLLETTEAGRKKVAAQLTEARIGFQDALAAQEDWTEWEKALLRRVEKRAPAAPEAQALPFLEKNFPRARELSALEWQAIGEWFGHSTQEKFLQQSFALNELPAAAGEAPQIVWVKDPFRRLSPGPDALEKSALEKIDPALITLELSAFPNLDDQAEELRHGILALGEKNFVLVSDGDASALVLRMLDLYPGLRDRENILGWVNVNGRLYGQAAIPAKKEKGRGLASLPDQFSENATRDRQRLRQEALVRGTPLGQGFPIVNVVSLDKAKRPAENLREALVAEGSSWFVAKGSAAQKIQQALPLLGPH